MKYKVSVIIPCYNEEKYIAQCFDSILENTIVKKLLEVYAVDGGSTDNTRDIIKEYSKKYELIQLLNNPKKNASSALNIGIKRSEGDVIIRMDAHAKYGKKYIENCVTYLKKYNADNVGGTINTIPGADTEQAKSIAWVLSSPFGVGNSDFRIGSKQPKWVDTVFGGCYKKEVFEKIGFFNENLERSQDFDFNLRLVRSGGKILLIPTIKSDYYAKSKLKDFFKHNFNDGVWAILPVKYGSPVFKIRHLLAGGFVGGLIFLIVISFFSMFFLWLFIIISTFYIITNFYFSFKISFQNKCIKCIPLVFTAFVFRHFGYGFGTLWGLLRLLGKE